MGRIITTVVTVVFLILSVENLPEECREYFDMLAVFDYDTLIPVTALATVWDVDEFDAEDYMNGMDGVV